MNNANFKKRVGDIIGGTNLLEIAGFKDKGDGFLHLDDLNHQKVKELIDILTEQIL